MIKTTLWAVAAAAILSVRCAANGNDWGFDATPDIDGDTGDSPREVPEAGADLLVEQPQELFHDETTDPADEEATDAPQCPPPPECAVPLTVGILPGIDERGCVAGYCCTGIEVTLEGVSVTSSAHYFTVSGTGEAANRGEATVVAATLNCGIINPVNDSVVAECENMTVVSDVSIQVGEATSFDFSPSCVIEGPEPCFDPVEVVCIYSWETTGCSGSGSSTVTVTTNFHCTG